MQISIHDPSQLLSHVLLQCETVSSAVAETKEWTEEGKITATVEFNGVKVPAGGLEHVLQELMDQVRAYYEEEYDTKSFDERVKEACEDNLREYSETLRESAIQAAQALENIIDSDPWG